MRWTQICFMATKKHFIHCNCRHLIKSQTFSQIPYAPFGNDYPNVWCPLQWWLLFVRRLRLLRCFTFHVSCNCDVRSEMVRSSGKQFICNSKPSRCLFENLTIARKWLCGRCLRCCQLEWHSCSISNHNSHINCRDDVNILQATNSVFRPIDRGRIYPNLWLSWN